MANPQAQDCGRYIPGCKGRFLPGRKCNRYPNHSDADRARLGSLHEGPQADHARITAEATVRGYSSLDRKSQIGLEHSQLSNYDYSDNSPMQAVVHAHQEGRKRVANRELISKHVPVEAAEKWSYAVAELGLNTDTAEALHTHGYDVVEATRPLQLSSVTSKMGNDRYDPEVEQLMQELDQNSFIDLVNDGILPPEDVFAIRMIQDKNPELGVEGAVYGYVQNQFADNQQLVSA